MGTAIAISGNKGGILKTSIAVNLVGEISKTHTVCLIDLDNQGNVCVSFGINPDDIETTVYDVLIGNSKLEDALLEVAPNISIIPSNDDMAYLEMDVLTNSERYPKPLSLLTPHVEKLKTMFDYVVIDTPPNMGMIIGNVFNSVDDIIIPYHPEVYSFRSMVKSIKAVNSFKETNSKLNIKAIVPVKVKRNLTHEAFMQSGKALCEQNNIKFTDTVITESIKYAEMIGRLQRPLTLVDPGTKNLKIYRDIYVQLCKELGYSG